jgi:ankyrin repeat protein
VVVAAAAASMASIHSAAERGDLAELKRLLEQDGQRLNAQNIHGLTPLMWVASNGHGAVMARLLALGADVRLQDVERRTAAWYACSSNHDASILSLLLDAGAPINAVHTSGATPLSQAAFFGAIACVALLVRGGSALELDAAGVSG